MNYYLNLIDMNLNNNIKILQGPSLEWTNVSYSIEQKSSINKIKKYENVK